MSRKARFRKTGQVSKNESTYAKELDKIKPVSTSKNVSPAKISAVSEMDYTLSATNTGASIYDPTNPIDVKTIMAKLIGVGHMILPKDIKHQKWLISCFFSVLFFCASIGNGIVIYGIETAIHDHCYSPFNKIIRSDKGDGIYICPSFAGGFVKREHFLWLRLFEIGSTVHTISIGIATSAVYYLNFSLIVIYVILFLIGLTLMLVSMITEIMFVKIGLFTYFNLSSYAVLSFLAFFIIDVIHLFASINLQLRWINYVIS